MEATRAHAMRVCSVCVVSCHVARLFFCFLLVVVVVVVVFVVFFLSFFFSSFSFFGEWRAILTLEPDSNARRQQRNTCESVALPFFPP